MAKKYYWLKLKNTFFESKEIKKMRKIAGGDTYVIIYLKMQLLSLENEGVIYYDSIEEDFASEIALTLDEDEENVRVTIGFLERYGLIEQKFSDEFSLTAVPDLIGKEGDSAERVRKHRALQCNRKALHCNVEVTDSNALETNCNTEKESENREKREDKEIHIDRDSRVGTDSIEECKNILTLFNSICISLLPVKNITDSRIRKILTIKQQYKNFDFESFFRRVEQSDFLTGRNGRWNAGGKNKANFDWVMKPDNIAKIQSGTYDNKKSKINSSNSSFSDFGSFDDEDFEFLETIGTNLKFF